MSFIVGIAKFGAFAALFLALTVSTIAKIQPELFLKVPNVGFILYAISGKPVPPFLDYELYNQDNFPNWIRDGDVVVATGAKSGTTWMCYCIDAIRRKGSDEIGLPYEDISYTTPWLEQMQVPGQSWAVRSELYNTTVLPNGNKLKDYWDNPAFPFRVFKSHMTPMPIEGKAKTLDGEVLPIRDYPKVKFVAMSRNGVEVVSSFHVFSDKHSEEFKSRWGGFPPTSSQEDTIRDFLPGGNLAFAYWQYVKSWWSFRNDPNVLLLHYADAKKDLTGTIRKLAKFVDVSLAGDELAKVEEKCGLKHMKANGRNFRYEQPLNPGSGVLFPGGDFVSKGKSDGGWSMPPDLKAKWDAAEMSQFADPVMRKWAAGGGGW